MLKRLGHPYVLLGLTAFVWGANAVAGKLAVGHVSPMMLTFLRWALSTVILAPFAWRHLPADWPAIRPRLPFFLMLGLAGFTGFNVLFYVALEYTSAIHVTIVQSAMPLFVFIGMFVFFRARVTVLQVFGFALTLCGVVLTAAHGYLPGLLDLEINRGDALMLLAVMLYGAYTVALSHKPDIHWLSTIFMICACAFLLSAPMLTVEYLLGSMRAPDMQGWAVVLFTTLVVSIGSQSLYIKGVEMIGANRANLFVNLSPVFGAILAVAILGEPLFAYHVAALALVLGGITLAERGKRRQRMLDFPPTPKPAE